MTSEITEKTAISLDIGDVVRTDASQQWVEVVDCRQPAKYGPWVYATVDPDTREYTGMITTKPENVPKGSDRYMVEVQTQASDAVATSDEED